MTELIEMEPMDEIIKEQEWMRWRILQQMERNAEYGDFTMSEIEETKRAFGLGGLNERA